LTFFPVNQAAVIAAAKAREVEEAALTYRDLVARLDRMPLPGDLEADERIDEAGNVNEAAVIRAVDVLASLREEPENEEAWALAEQIEPYIGYWEEYQKLDPDQIDYGILGGKGITRIAATKDVDQAVTRLEERIQRGYGAQGQLTLSTVGPGGQIKPTWRRGLPVSDSLVFGEGKEAAFLSLGQITDPEGVMLVPVETGKDSVRVAESVLLSALSSGMWDFASGSWAPGSIQFALPFPGEDDVAQSQRLASYICGNRHLLQGSVPGAFFRSAKPILGRIDLVQYDPASVAGIDQRVFQAVLEVPGQAPIPFSGSYRSSEDEKTKKKAPSGYRSQVNGVPFVLRRVKGGWEIVTEDGEGFLLEEVGSSLSCPSTAFLSDLTKALQNIRTAAGLRESAMAPVSVSPIASAAFFVRSLQAAAIRTGNQKNNQMADQLFRAVTAQEQYVALSREKATLEIIRRDLGRKLRDDFDERRYAKIPVALARSASPVGQAIVQGQTFRSSALSRKADASGLLVGLFFEEPQESTMPVQGLHLGFYYLKQASKDTFSAEPVPLGNERWMPVLYFSVEKALQPIQDQEAQALRRAQSVERDLANLIDPIQEKLFEMPVRYVFTYPQQSELGENKLTYYGDDMILRAVPQNRLGWREFLAGGERKAGQIPSVAGMRRYGRMDLPTGKDPRSVSLRAKVKEYGDLEKQLFSLDAYTQSAVSDALEEGKRQAARFEDQVQRSVMRKARAQRYLPLEKVKGDPEATRVLSSLVLTIYGVLDDTALTLMEERCGCPGGSGPSACRDMAHRAYKRQLLAAKHQALQKIQDSNLPTAAKEEEKAKAMALSAKDYMPYPIYGVFWQSPTLIPGEDVGGAYDLIVQATGQSVLNTTDFRMEAEEMLPPEAGLVQGVVRIEIPGDKIGLIDEENPYFLHTEFAGYGAGLGLQPGQKARAVTQDGEEIVIRFRGAKAFDELETEDEDEAAMALGAMDYADFLARSEGTAVGAWARGKGRRDVFDVVFELDDIPPVMAIGDSIINPLFLLRRWAARTSGLHILAEEWMKLEKANEAQLPVPFELLGAVSVDVAGLKKLLGKQTVLSVPTASGRPQQGVVLTSINLIRGRGSAVPLPEDLVAVASGPLAGTGLYVQPIGVEQDVRTLLNYALQAKWDKRRNILSPAFGTSDQTTFSLYSPANVAQTVGAKDVLEPDTYYEVLAGEADPGPSRTSAGQRAARRAVRGLARGRGAMVKYREGVGSGDPDIAGAVFGTKKGMGRKNLFLFGLKICSATGRCTYRSTKKATLLSGLLSDIAFKPLEAFGVSEGQVVQSMTDGSTLPTKVASGTYVSQLFPPEDGEEAVNVQVTVAKGQASFKPLNAQQEEALSSTNWVYGAMRRYDVAMPTSRKPAELIDRLKELKEKLQLQYDLVSTHGVLLRDAEDVNPEVEELVESMSPRKYVRAKRNPRRRRARRNGLSPAMIAIAQAIAKGREVPVEDRRQLKEALSKLGVPDSFPMTAERINQLFPRRGKERGTWEVDRRFARLADVDLITQVGRAPELEYADFRWKEPMPFLGPDADIVGRQAQLSVTEAGKIIKAQQATRRRGYTQQPSSAICSLYRRRKLKTFLLPANIYEAVNVNRSIIILMSPVGEAPRVMTWRRGSHIDCDMTGTEPAELSFFLGKAIQSALFWLGEKRGRKGTAIYVGRVGDDKLYTAWGSGDPLTVGAVTARLQNAAQKAAEMQGLAPSARGSAFAAAGIVPLSAPTELTPGSGLNTRNYYRQAYARLFQVEAPRYQEPSGGTPGGSPPPPPPAAGASTAEQKSSFIPPGSYEDLDLD
jgi:hypothetical protein